MPLMPRGMMLLSLEREKLMNRGDGHRISTPDPHFAASRPIDRFVADRGATLRHHVCPWDDLRVHGERL